METEERGHEGHNLGAESTEVQGAQSTRNRKQTADCHGWPKHRSPGGRKESCVGARSQGRT